MNTLVENNIITELEYGSNFSYILNDAGIFLSTEYKVLQSQANSCFVKCMKMMYNGKIQLYYLTKSLRPLTSLIPTLNADNFMAIVANLFSDIIDVQHNGFLSCRNIDISFEHIFVDPSTHKVRLMYLPLSKRLYDDDSTFENEIRTGLVKLISGISTLSTPKTMQLMADLSNGSLSIEELYNRIKGVNPVKVAVVNDVQVSAGTMHFIALNVPTKLELLIDKDEYVIGKKADLCDGVIDFNKLISRVHCKICRKGDRFTITDLQSVNGTFVNKVPLQPNTPHAIEDGDIVRLANSDFQISIK